MKKLPVTRAKKAVLGRFSAKPKISIDQAKRMSDADLEKELRKRGLVP